jgi:hypothetical protein
MPRLVKSGSGTRIGARFAGTWSGTPHLTCAEPPPMFCIHIVQRKLGINLHAVFESPAYDREGLHSRIFNAFRLRVL